MSIEALLDIEEALEYYIEKFDSAQAKDMLEDVRARLDLKYKEAIL